MTLRFRTLLSATLFLVAVGAAFALRATSEPPPVPAPTLPVRAVAVVMQDTFASDARLAGKVVSRRASDLGFERGGRLDTVAVDEGAQVQAGDVLAALDTRELHAQARELRARVQASRARLDLARSTARRRSDLHQAEYLSSQGLDEALSDERARAAQLAADRAALERVMVALELSELRAPYAAVVTERNVDEGTVVSPGVPVLRVLEVGVQELRIGVPPELAASLEIGRVYPADVDERRVPATLRRVLPALDPVTRTQTAILELETRDAVIADGALASVSFGRDLPTRGCWLPLGALAEGRRGMWTAYALVESADGAMTVERRQVEVIHAEPDRVFVRGTLRDGERVVADGVHRLVPGLRVRVPDADASLPTPDHA